MLRHATVTLAIMTLFSVSANAGVHVGAAARDEIAHTALFQIDLRSSIYEDYDLEDYLRFQCGSDGNIAAKLHWGGIYTGGNIGGTGTIVIKFDEAAPIQLTAEDLQDSTTAGQLFSRVLASKTLLLNIPLLAVGGQMQTWRVDLNGIRDAGGPASEFGKQCAKAIGIHG